VQLYEGKSVVYRHQGVFNYEMMFDDEICIWGSTGVNVCELCGLNTLITHHGSRSSPASSSSKLKICMVHQIEI
jgi:hypothetical protein